jgi:O-antigen ligase
MKKILPKVDLTMLALMILSLPSLEAPKNIFLVGYLLTRIITEISQFKKNIWHWRAWDTLFLSIVLTALLSSIFAGFSGYEEWKGYKVLLTAILTGWLLSRARYTKSQYQILFKLAVLSTIPPLAWGLWEYVVIHSRKTLEIHSVGHVNHSAIYLVMIFGASLAWFLSQVDTKKKSIGFKWETILLGFLSFIFFISLIIGQSRGAFGIGIILGLILFFLCRKKSIKIIGAMTISSILFFSVLLNTSIVQKQVAYQENHNVLSYRDRVWNVSLEAARFHPLLGIGMSNWHFISLEQLKKSVEARGETFNSNQYAFPGHSHNLYLTALVERGIVGLIVTFLFMIAWIRELIKTYSSAKKTVESSFIWGGALSAWVATYGIGLVNTTFHHEHAILACLFLGIYLGYMRFFLKEKISV